MKILAHKTIMAARADALHERPTGDMGRELLEQVCFSSSNKNNNI